MITFFKDLRWNCIWLIRCGYQTALMNTTCSLFIFRKFPFHHNVLFISLSQRCRFGCHDVSRLAVGVWQILDNSTAGTPFVKAGIKCTLLTKMRQNYKCFSHADVCWELNVAHVKKIKNIYLLMVFKVCIGSNTAECTGHMMNWFTKTN